MQEQQVPLSQQVLATLERIGFAPKPGESPEQGSQRTNMLRDVLETQARSLGWGPREGETESDFRDSLSVDNGCIYIQYIRR